jgi:hypothetical protein
MCRSRSGGCFEVIFFYLTNTRSDPICLSLSGFLRTRDSVLDKSSNWNNLRAPHLCEEQNTFSKTVGPSTALRSVPTWCVQLINTYLLVSRDVKPTVVSFTSFRILYRDGLLILAERNLIAANRKPARSGGRWVPKNIRI